MRVALLNPRWFFDDSVYSRCRDPRLPLEHGYAATSTTRGRVRSPRLRNE
jgi:hypothetical protein